MYARLALLFLLAGAAHQGLAASVPSTNDVGYSYDAYDAIGIATDIIPRLGFANGLTRGIEQCRILLRSVSSGISAFFKNIYAFKDDAVRAYEEYKGCDSAVTVEAVTICRNAVKKEYFDSIRLRSQFLVEAFKQSFVSAVKLPVCIFLKP